MNWNKIIPRWEGTVVEPPEQKKTDGFIAGDRPPAFWENWFRKGISESVEETQENVDLLETEVEGLREEINSPDFNTIQLTALQQIKSVVDSYGGVAEFIASGATLFQAIVDGENKPNGTTRSFTGENGIVYFVKPTNIFVTGTGATINVTNNTGVNANIMAIPVTGTPYQSDTINQINSRIGEYWEGLRSGEKVDVGSKDDLGNITSTAKIHCVDRTKFDLALLPNGVQNTVEYKDGKYSAIKKIGTDNLDGTKSWTGFTTTGDNYRVEIANYNNAHGNFVAFGYNKKHTFKWYNATGDVPINEFGLAMSGTRLFVILGKAYMEANHSLNTTGAIQYLTENPISIYYQLATPITVPESEFAEYGIDIDGLLTSNNDFTEFYVDNYDLFAPTDVSYSTNLAKAVENNKEAIQGLRAFTSNQNLINLEFDARITLLE